jgi:hypothetical protein
VQEEFAVSIAHGQGVAIDIDYQEIRRAAVQMATIADAERRVIRRRGCYAVQIATSKAARFHTGHPSTPKGVFGFPPRSIRHLS